MTPFPLEIHTTPTDQIHPTAPMTPDATWCLNLYYTAARPMPLVPEGHPLGHEQLILYRARGLSELPAGDAAPPVAVEPGFFTVSGKNFTYRFDRRTGAFASIVRGDRELLLRPAQWNVWRAPTDNDRIIKLDWVRAGYDRACARVYRSEAEQNGGLAVLTFQMALTAVSIQRLVSMTVRFMIAPDGTVDLHCHGSRDGGLPPLPRFGLRMFLPRNFVHCRYFGFGPEESYVDKRAAAMLGLWAETADAKTEHIRPQEERSHWGCTELTLSDGGGAALHVCSEQDFSFSALTLTQEELTEKRHDFELEPCDACVLCMDHRQAGIGSGSCGPELAAPYTIEERDFSFHWRFTPS